MNTGIYKLPSLLLALALVSVFSGCVTGPVVPDEGMTIEKAISTIKKFEIKRLENLHKEDKANRLTADKIMVTDTYFTHPFFEKANFEDPYIKGEWKLKKIKFSDLKKIEYRYTSLNIMGILIIIGPTMFEIQDESGLISKSIREEYLMSTFYRSIFPLWYVGFSLWADIETDRYFQALAFMRDWQKAPKIKKKPKKSKPSDEKKDKKGPEKKQKVPPK